LRNETPLPMFVASFSDPFNGSSRPSGNGRSSVLKGMPVWIDEIRPVRRLKPVWLMPSSPLPVSGRNDRP
jgi:hypothetical protein